MKIIDDIDAALLPVIFTHTFRRGKAEIPREQFPRNILVGNVTTVSLTCHEKIGRVGRV